MFMEAYLPVNDSQANSCLQEVAEQHVAPVTVPVPGEDGELQSISGLTFNVCLALAAIGALLGLLTQAPHL